MAQGYAAVILSMFIWGSVGIFARHAETAPLIAVVYRLLFGAAAMAAVTYWQRPDRATAAAAPAPDGRRTLSRPLLLLASGATLAANWVFFFKAIEVTSVSNAVLSYYMAPVFVALASPLVLGERLERRTMLATALAFGGLFVMLYQPGRFLSTADMAGIGYGLTAAVFYAGVTLMVRRWLSDMPATRLVLVQCISAAAVLLPVVALSSGLRSMVISGSSMALLAVVGVIHTALALVLYFHGLRTVKVQHVGVLAYLDPVSAVLFAFVFLGEIPTPASLAGGTLVLAGSALLLERKA